MAEIWQPERYEPLYGKIEPTWSEEQRKRLQAIRNEQFDCELCKRRPADLQPVLRRLHREGRVTLAERETALEKARKAATPIGARLHSSHRRLGPYRRARGFSTTESDNGGGRICSTPDWDEFFDLTEKVITIFRAARSGNGVPTLISAEKETHGRRTTAVDQAGEATDHRIRGYAA